MQPVDLMHVYELALNDIIYNFYFFWQKVASELLRFTN